MRPFLLALPFCLLACGTAQSADAPPKKLSAEEVRKLVRQLDDDNFAVRQQADAALRKAGKDVVPLLRKELARTKSVEVRKRLRQIVGSPPPPELDEKQIRKLIHQLGDDAFDVRQNATNQLVVAGKKFVPLLRKELAAAKDLEIRCRLEKILKDIDGKK